MTTAPETLPTTVGYNIRERRKALGLTLTQLADKMGTYAGYLSNVESGANITVSRLEDFAEALSCTATDLLLIGNSKLELPTLEPTSQEHV